MKKFLLSFFFLSFSYVVFAQIKSSRQFVHPYNKKITSSPILHRAGTSNTQSVSGLLREGFENTSFPPSGWQTVNVMGPEVWSRITFLQHSGLASAFCKYEQNASAGEDWLIMPKFNVAATDSLHFWLGITDPGWIYDSLWVVVSKTDSALTSFTDTLLAVSDGHGYPTVHFGFVQFNISLAAYAGQSIYIGFYNWNINGDGVSIDDVQLGTPYAKDAAAVSWDKQHILGDTAQSVTGTVKNVGTSTQTFNVTMTITGGYSSTQTVTSLAPNISQQINFATWTPNVTGTNIVKMYTQLAGDGYVQNDTLIDTLHISHISTNDIKSVSIDMLPKTSNLAQTPKATVRNNGFNTESFNVTMTISGGYSSTIPVTNLAPFTTQQISFASWTPNVIGNNNVKVFSQLATDADKTNDTIQNTIQVFQEFQNFGWSSKPPMANKSSGNASAFYHTGSYPNDTSLIFSLGGVDSTGIFLNENNSFSSVTNNWSSATTLPISHYLGSSQTVKGKIYLIGGFDPSFTVLKRNDVYDIATNTWSVGATIPEPLTDFASAVYKDSLIYVIGGWDSLSAPTNVVYIYNTYTNSWSQATSKTGIATYGLRGGIYQNKIVVVGGYGNSAIQNQATLGVINPASTNNITWSALANYPGFPIERHSGGSVYKDELPLIIFTCGDTAGYATAGVTYYTKETWGYDLVSNSWKIGPPKITGTNNNCNLLGGVFNDSLYMISVGGNDGGNGLKVQEWLNLGLDTSHFTGIDHFKLEAATVGVYPNPFNDKINITINLIKEQKVNVSIFDIHGRFVTELCNKNLNEGNHIITWNSSNSVSGIYIVRAVIGNSVLNKKLIKN